MEILRQKSDVWGECPTVRSEAVLWIERAGRVCYRSEDKIVEGSGDIFVNNIIKRNHLAVIEHSNLVVRSAIGHSSEAVLMFIKNKYDSNFLKKEFHKGRAYIGGNYRAWMEQLGIDNLDDLFSGMFLPYEIVTDVKEIPLSLKMVTVSFLTDRAVTHELERHRPVSYCQESQRYCAYRNHLEVILPIHYIDGNDEIIQDVCFKSWKQTMEYCEKHYKFLLLNKKKAEQARDVLPNSTATRVAMTASLPEWNIIFKLRTAPVAYPGIRNLMIPVKEEFERRGWII